MTVEYKETGLKDMQRALIKLRQAVGQGRVEPMEKVGGEAIKIIISRTKDGRDVNGNKFTPYCDSYAKKKPGAPDLTLSGDMLKNIKFQAWTKKCRIYLALGFDRVKGIVHNNRGRSGRGTGFAMPQREFMGVQKEVDKLRKIFRDWWEKYAKDLGL